jgi:hypothetical protein
MTEPAGSSRSAAGLGELTRKYREAALAGWSLVAAQFDVWRRSNGQLVSAGTMSPDEGDPARLPEARRVAAMVRLVAERGPLRPSCLVRSLAIARRLRSEGLPGGRVRVGVSLQDATKFAAHAWVEYAGEVIGDDPAQVSRFSSVEDLNVLSRP